MKEGKFIRGVCPSTCFILTWKKLNLLQYFQPSLYSGRYIATTVSGGKQVQLQLWDSAGGEEYDRSRPYGYLGAALVVICFGVSNLKSFRNINERWIPEIMHFLSSPRVPALLVGCKTDLRAAISGPGGWTAVSIEQGHATAATIGAEKYMECSSLTGEGVGDIAEATAQISASWDPRPWYSRESTCHIV